jgi:hypothetical protein
MFDFQKKIDLKGKYKKIKIKFHEKFTLNSPLSKELLNSHNHNIFF